MDQSKKVKRSSPPLLLIWHYDLIKRGQKGKLEVVAAPLLVLLAP